MVANGIGILVVVSHELVRWWQDRRIRQGQSRRENTMPQLEKGVNCGGPYA